MLASLLSADRAFGLWLASALAGPWMDRVMITATIIGIRGSVWVVAALWLLFARPAHRMAAWRLLLSLGLAGLITDATLKPLVGRARPFVDHPEYRELLPVPETRSFPSGHASTNAAGAVAFPRIFPAAAIPAAALALLIGTSRIALGVHFPSDVLAGFLIGYLCARFVCARPPREDVESVRPML